MATQEGQSIRESGESTSGSSPEFERLRVKRGANRAVATRLEKEADAIIAQGDFDESKLSRITVIEKLLEEKLRLLSELDEQIIGYIDTGAIEHDILASSEIESRVRDIQERIRRTIANSEKETIEATRDIRDTRSEQHSLSSPRNRENIASPTIRSRSVIGGSGAKPRLPKINLPRFNGEITRFSSFWDSFESLVHKNEELSGIDKFNYLVSLLEGPAARAVQGLPLTETNYDHAVELLKERYGNKQKIVSAHMEELLKLPICSQEKTSELRSLYDKINIHIRGLESLGVNAEHYGSLLIPVLMQRIPKNIALQIARQSSKDVWHMTEILEIIRSEVEAREMSENVITKEAKVGYFQKPKPPPSTMSAFYAKGEEKGQWCLFCKGNHRASNCDNVREPKERKEKLRQSGRCYICLSQQHVAKNCNRRQRCKNCGYFHHVLICGADKKTSSQNEDEKPAKTSIATTVNEGKSKSGTVLLQMAKTFACNDSGNKVPVKILFDLGSQRSYLTENLKERLGLTSKNSEVLYLNTFGTSKVAKHNCQKVSFQLETLDNDFVTVSALSFPEICTPLAGPIDISEFPHLQGLMLADRPDKLNDWESEHIDILLGADQYFSFVKGDIIRGSSGPVAVRSELGWLISGPVGNDGAEVCNSSCVVNNLSIVEGRINSGEFEMREKEEALFNFKRAWEIESEEQESSHTKSFSEACNIRFNGERYVVGLPWQEDTPQPQNNNYGLCLNRLNSLKSRLNNEPELLGKYNDNFVEQEKTGIIERVPEKDVSGINQENVNFLPHFGVVNESRQTTKLRVVFDASAKSAENEISLNDRLQNGPNYIPLLFEVLLRFRCHAIAVTADIEKAFLQIEIQESDREQLRFLWFENIEHEVPKVIQYRHKRLVFGLIPSPSILGACVKKHLSQYKERFPKICEVLDRLFVDDLSCSTDSVEEALEICTVSKEVLREGGFNLHKFKTNSGELRKQLCELESRKQANCQAVEINKETPESNHSVMASEECKILGVKWNCGNDAISVEIAEVVKFGKSLAITKRSLLKLTAKVFDPLGILTPFTVRMKVKFQQLCIEKVGWDDPLCGEMRLR